MSRLRAWLLLGAMVLPSGVSGCSAEPAESEGAGEGEGVDEIRASLVGSVSGVRIRGAMVLGAPSKVERVLRNIGLAHGSPRPSEGGIGCAPSYAIELLDARGNVRSTAGFSCDTGGPRQLVAGSIVAGGRSYALTAHDLDAIDAIAAEPAAVGDVLFGVDRVEIGAGLLGRAKQTSERAKVLKVVRSMNVDLPPDPYARMARCLPNRVVSFWQGARQLASVSFACAEDERGIVVGAFSGRDSQVSGGIAIHAGTVLDVESGL